MQSLPLCRRSQRFVYLAAGDFDDWNPRGETGTGGTPGPRKPSLGQSALGE